MSVGTCHCVVLETVTKFLPISNIGILLNQGIEGWITFETPTKYSTTVCKIDVCLFSPGPMSLQGAWNKKVT